MSKKHFLLFAVLTILVSAIMFFACGETGQGEGADCDSTLNCLGGEICDPINKVCKSQTYCGTDDDRCEYAYYCSGSFCTPAVECPTGVECASITAADGRAVSCQDGYCLPGAGSVTDGDTGNQSGCNVDGCPYGYNCETDTGTCIPNTADGDYGTTDGDTSVDGDEATDPCDPNPCAEENKAVCTDDGSGNAVCSCNSGYHDESGTCVPTTTDDPCAPNPCADAHKTVCADDGLGNAVCSCDEGYHDESGVCVVNGSTSDTKGKFCQTIPAATTGYDPMCVIVGDTELRANAETCGTCTGLVTGQLLTVSLTDCSGEVLLSFELETPLLDSADYIWALGPDPESSGLVLFSFELDRSTNTCDSVTYQDVVNSVNQ